MTCVTRAVRVPNILSLITPFPGSTYSLSPDGSPQIAVHRNGELIPFGMSGANVFTNANRSGALLPFRWAESLGRGDGWFVRMTPSTLYWVYGAGTSPNVWLSLEGSGIANPYIFGNSPGLSAGLLTGILEFSRSSTGPSEMVINIAVQVTGGGA